MAVASPVSLISGSYQIEKFIKHTVPVSMYMHRFVSIFDNPTYDAYRGYTIDSSGSGCLEIDDGGRRSLIYVAGRRVGATYRNGLYVRPDDAIRVVWYENEWKIHTYPTYSEYVETQTCADCGRPVAY